MSVPLVAVGTTKQAILLVNLEPLELAEPLVVAVDLEHLELLVAVDLLVVVAPLVDLEHLDLLVVVHRVVLDLLAHLDLLAPLVALALLVVVVVVVNLAPLEPLDSVAHLDNLDNLDALAEVVVIGACLVAHHLVRVTLSVNKSLAVVEQQDAQLTAVHTK